MVGAPVKTRVSTSKSKALILSQQTVDCLLQIGVICFPKCRCLVHKWTPSRDSSTPHGISWWIITTEAVMQFSYTVVKCLHMWSWGLSIDWNKTLSILKGCLGWPSVTVPASGIWKKLKTKAFAPLHWKSQLRRLRTATSGDVHYTDTTESWKSVWADPARRSSDIQKGIRAESLLLDDDRSHLRWFKDLDRMLPRCLPMDVFSTCPVWNRPQSQNLLGGLYLPAGLEIIWCPPAEAGGSLPGKFRCLIGLK